jgi:hypothetical protein
MTIVVNLRDTHEFDIKITRHPKLGITEPPNFGCFGNPFPVEKFGRDECLRLYKAHFDARILKDEKFRAAILSLKGKRLACFCKPLACHGDIIKEWLDTH